MVTAEKIKVLVIDDDQVLCEMVKRSLQRKNYDVYLACNGKDGLEKIKQHDIQIVFSDIVMPEMDGIGFLKQVHNYNLSTQVIMMTGKSDLENCVEAVEYGACSYLIKPVQIDDLVESINIALRNIAEKKEIVKKVLAESQKRKEEQK